MRHQLGEGEERKKQHKKVTGREITGSGKSDPATDTDYQDIDPADFFDPEEFGVRRRFMHDG
jgi:hypothetical protein